ncbi:MAG: M48 family metallopeptidase [Alphaproteobacteria bacterium]|nr:M48 family metallopeptidase [Alphaproteobacteria bacterium]
MIKDLVTVKRSKRARHVALRLDPVERVINLIVPRHMPLNKAYRFAQDHEDWVKKTLGKLPETIPFTHDTILPVFGDKVRLDIAIDPTLKRTTLKQCDDALYIKTYQQDPANRITMHLKKIARAGLADIVSDKASGIGKSVKSVTIRDTKSRWGSCSQDANMSFSWRLIFAPYSAIDYVVAHEVSHLIHMDHSPAFWEVCKSLSCDYKNGKRWMKENGNSLMCYGKKL